MPPLGNLLTLKSVTFRTSFSVFHCIPALSISRAGEAITKTIPCDRRKLIKMMLRKCTFLLPHSHLLGQFVKRHLVTTWRTTRSGAVVETIYLSRPQRAQCICLPASVTAKETAVPALTWTHFLSRSNPICVGSFFSSASFPRPKRP